MVDALERALSAQRCYRERDGTIVTEDDCKVQLAAVIWMTAHMVGEPTRRIVHEHHGELPDPSAMLDNNPTLLAAMERQLEKARRRQRQAASETLDLAGS